jgi:esterase/lipase superfamily enzyme
MVLLLLIAGGCGGGDRSEAVPGDKSGPSIGPAGPIDELEVDAGPPGGRPGPDVDSVAVTGDGDPRIVRLFYATDRAPTGSGDTEDFYGGAYDSTVRYGRLAVSIPPGHQVGELESPSVFRFEFREDPEKHVVLSSIEPLEPDDFFGQLRDSIASSVDREALVFIHGYNVSFHRAARRTAQLAYDLRFLGVPILYSWPSDGAFLRYAADEQDVRLTAPHLATFLKDVARRTGARRVHVVAHSMGSRALASALTEIGREVTQPLLDEVIFAAPDIDSREFREIVAPGIVHVAERVTLYASSRDRALQVSRRLHDYPRAGDSGEELTVVEGVETIDASVIDTSLLGHSYFADAFQLVGDLLAVIRDGLPPPERELLPRQKAGLPYWSFGEGGS